jgi:hypothetical protein
MYFGAQVMAVSFCASVILVLYPFVSVIIIQAIPFCKSIILALLWLIFIITFMPKKAMLVSDYESVSRSSNAFKQ